MKKVWDLCKVLENCHRRGLLAEVYMHHVGGCCVSDLVTLMQGKLKPPAVTQYLKQLEQLGLLRRRRDGNHVYYADDMRDASMEVAEVARLIRDEIFISGSYDDKGMFRALMNAFRARVCHYLLNGGDGMKSKICERFNHCGKYIDRDLQLAVEAGLMVEHNGVYELIRPDDPIVCRVIELVV